MGGGNVNSGNPQEGYSGGIAGTDTLPVPVLRGFSRSAKQDSEASARRAEEGAKRTLPVLRGFSRSARQDSEASTRRAEERAKRTLPFLGIGRDIVPRRIHQDPNLSGALPPRAGFTLVELIVTMLIAVILIAITITFLTSGGSFLARTEASASDKALAQGAADFIKDQLLYANEVKVVYVDDGDPVPPDPSSLNGFVVLYIGGEDGKVANTGRLYYKRPDADEYADILGDGMYRGKDLAFEYNATVTTPGGGASKTAVFEVVAKAVRDGTQAKEARQTFRMYNIGLNSEPAVDASAVSWDGDSPGKNKKFYLLITAGQGSDDYVSAGLIMELSGIYNSIDSEGNPYHDPGSGSYEYGGSWKDLSVLRDPSKTKIGNDVELYGKKVGDKWIEFRDDGDYGQTRRPLDLRSFDQVTVEICFRVDTANDTANSAGVLYEMPSPPNYFTGAIGAGINTERYGEWYFPRPGKAYTIGKQGNQNDSNATENYFIGMRNYEFSLDPSKFTTHTTVYSCIDDPTGRQTFVDGVAVPYYEHVINASLKHPASTRTYAANSPEFRNDYLYIVEYEMDGDSQLPCDIAAMRIYGRKLNPDEIARNAALDQLLYNG